MFNKVNKILLIPVSPLAAPSKLGPNSLGPGRDVFVPIKPQGRYLPPVAPLSVFTGIYLLLKKYGRKGSGHKKEISMEGQKPVVVILPGDLNPRFSIRKSSREGNYEILPGSYQGGRYVPWKHEIVVDGRPLVVESWFPLQEGDLIQSGEYYFTFQLSEEEPVERRKKELRTLEETAAALRSTVDERERKAKELGSVDAELKEKTAALAGVKGELASQTEALEEVTRTYVTTKANLETANQDLERLLLRIREESASWEDRLSEAGKTFRSQEATTASLKSDAEEFERQVEKLGSVTAELARVGGELASQEEALKTLNKEHAGVNMALEMATQVLQTKNDDAAAAENRKREAEQALKSPEERAAALGSTVEKLRRETVELGPVTAALAGVKDELERRTAELEGVKKEIPLKKAEVDLAEGDLQRIKGEAVDSENRVREAKKTLGPLETRRQELEPYLGGLEKERTDLEQRVGELRRQAEELGPEVADLEGKREERIRLISDIETKNAELGRAVDERNRLWKEAQELKPLVAEKAGLEESIRQLKESEPVLRGVVDDLTKRADALRREIAEVQKRGQVNQPPPLPKVIVSLPEDPETAALKKIEIDPREFTDRSWRRISVSPFLKMEMGRLRDTVKNNLNLTELDELAEREKDSNQAFKTMMDKIGAQIDDDLYLAYTQRDPQGTLFMPGASLEWTKQLLDELTKERLPYIPAQGWIFGGRREKRRMDGRIYLSLNRDYAAHVWRQLHYFFYEDAKQQTPRVPLVSYKMSSNPETWHRSDSAVIYFYREDQEWVYDQILAMALRDHFFKPGRPVFTLPVLGLDNNELTGISFGQEPAQKMSFGEVRATAIRRGIDLMTMINAKGEKPSWEEAIQISALFLEKFGIDSNLPALNKEGREIFRPLLAHTPL